jgi:hypothetical protein
MADTVDPLLNDYVDRHVQAVNYRQLVGIRPRLATVAGFRLDWLESGQNNRVPDHLAGILDGSDRSSYIPGQSGMIQPLWPGSS